jgi:hypothetical protein
MTLAEKSIAAGTVAEMRWPKHLPDIDTIIHIWSKLGIHAVIFDNAVWKTASNQNYNIKYAKSIELSKCVLKYE